MKKNLSRLSKEAKGGELVELVFNKNKEVIHAVGYYVGVSRSSYYTGSRLTSVRDFVHITPLHNNDNSRESTISVTFEVPMKSIRAYNIIKDRNF